MPTFMLTLTPNILTFTAQTRAYCNLVHSIQPQWKRSVQKTLNSLNYSLKPDEVWDLRLEILWNTLSFLHDSLLVLHLVFTVWFGEAVLREFNTPWIHNLSSRWIESFLKWKQWSLQLHTALDTFEMKSNDEWRSVALLFTNAVLRLGQADPGTEVAADMSFGRDRLS